MRFFLSCFIVIMNISTSVAQPLNLSVSASTSLENTLAHIQTLQANFSETVSSNQQITQKLSGTFMLKKPGKFFWKTLKPIHQDIMSDGKKIWIYDKDLEQIMVKSLTDNVGATPALLLNGKYGSIAQNYSVKQIPASSEVSNKESLYTLTPKQQTLYHYIQMFFKGNILTHMRFEDNLGQLTDFYFTEVKVNQAISDHLFIFIPPKGVDIVNG